MMLAAMSSSPPDCRFCQLEPKRGLAVLGAPMYVTCNGRDGETMYHLLRADEFDATRAKI